MQMGKILVYFILVSLSLSADIIFDLQPLANSTQPPITKNITLRPKQVFTYESDYLEYNNVHFDGCNNFRGSLFMQIVGQIPVRSNVTDFQQAYTDKYGIIYLLQHQNVQAFKFSQNKRIVSYIDKVDFKNSHCGAQIALSDDGQFLYHFSCFKITRIQLKKSFSSIKIQLQLTQAFYGHKVLSGMGFFVWISYSQGVRVYQVLNDTLALGQTLERFSNQQSSYEKITDAALKANRLYLLGHESAIYIFDQLGNGTFQSKLNISLKALCLSCKHQQIIVSQSSIYIYSMENREQFVSELQLNANSDQVYFVRYYKGHQNFVGMEIFNGRLLTISNHIMNLYETNRDPRTIKSKVNGVSNNHLEPILKMSRISDNLFLKITSTSVQLIKLLIRKPYVECQYLQQSKIVMEINQLCRESISIKKTQYWESCLTKDILNIMVQEEKKERHIFAVASVFLFCSTVIAVLAIWRRSKIDLIEALVIQINKLRKNKTQQRIEFVEQKQVTREVNWSEIQEPQDRSQKDGRWNDQKGEQMEQQIGQDNQEGGQMQGTQRHMEVKK